MRKRETKRGVEGGGGATICHNKLQPSKVANAWPNVPFNVSDAVFNSPRVSVKTFDDGVAFELPSARRVSNIMTSPSNTVSGEHTVMVMQMGQVRTIDI